MMIGSITGVNVDSAAVDALIENIIGAIQHRVATAYRLQAIAGTLDVPTTAPTIGSDDDARVFAFPPTIRTAAFLATLRPPNFRRLQENLELVQLPGLEEFESMAAVAREVPRYRGVSKLFKPRPVEGERVIDWMQSVDTAGIHALLREIDATLGSTEYGSFAGLDVLSHRRLIEDHLAQLTGWPISWVDAEQVERHREAVTSITAARQLERKLEEDVQKAADALCQQQAQRELNSTDISVLDRITDGRVRLGLLKRFTIPQLAAAETSELLRIDGVGEKTATQAIAAARSYSADVLNSQVPVINFQDKGPSTPYVVALAKLLVYRDKTVHVPPAPLQLEHVEPGTPVAIAGVNDLLSDSDFRQPPPDLTSSEAWNLYAIRAAEFHAYGDSAEQSSVPADIAERIADITLRGRIRGSLRGYQSFGAKFALAQQKVLIGDEMGLGKTLQALALLAHLQGEHEYSPSASAAHSLVVCPPSLRLNWSRELEKFTDLRAHVIHGPYKEAELEAWKQRGGVAIAGFPEVRGHKLAAAVEGIELDCLVVDEAHRTKNPRSQQSQGVRELTRSARYALYLTGTPLENRVAEFETLLGYLDPSMLPKLSSLRNNASEFKKAIARIYLRRNQEEVLGELPPMLEIEEWVEPKPAEVEIYEDAVRRSAFMDMRQAYSRPKSAKMERIHEIVDDGAEDGKTIIFSFFRSVVDELCTSLGKRAYGPIAGGVSFDNRQKAVDEFTAASAGAVLVCQITAASEGLNVQAAHRVILCEPQLNPAVEAQAIARAHRMGQVKTVEVHRLLTPESVDEKLFDMLASKRSLFDRFARDSVSADSMPEAMDVSESALVEEVIAAERARIGEAPRL